MAGTKGRMLLRGAAALAVSAVMAAPALAHDVSEHARQMMLEGGLIDVVWIGAEHMLTGYDHLLFLLGVLFFLQGFGPIVRFITAFTLGHTLTLMGATMLGITANAYLVDAVIALTVCYKAFENLGLFRSWFGVDAPNLIYMVFLFGLIHGFGLSTRLQDMTLVEDSALVSKILAFNVGVELGQVAALSLMIGVVRLWRQTTVWTPVMRAANLALLVAGLGLFAVQMDGFVRDDTQVAAMVATSAKG
ncbi:HupE/UreJ family protein [Sphingomonas sp. IW22]|uniref:HupE/UreJ family protein n=1 Tax=Sphingomonas sp. IW22 TaxID=3242489 RepID=UPI00351F9669